MTQDMASQAEVDEDKVEEAQEKAGDVEEYKPELEDSKISNLDELVEPPSLDDQACAAHIPTGEECDENGETVTKTQKLSMGKKSA